MDNPVKVTHTGIGECWITHEALIMQATNNPEPKDTIWVEHEGDLKRVSKHLISDLPKGKNTK